MCCLAKCFASSTLACCLLCVVFVEPQFEMDPTYVDLSMVRGRWQASCCSTFRNWGSERMTPHLACSQLNRMGSTWCADAVCARYLQGQAQLRYDANWLDQCVDRAINEVGPPSVPRRTASKLIPCHMLYL